MIIAISALYPSVTIPPPSKNTLSTHTVDNPGPGISYLNRPK